MDMVANMIHDLENGVGKIINIRAINGDMDIEGEFGILSIDYISGIVPSSLLLFNTESRVIVEVSLGAVKEYEISSRILDTEGLVGSTAIVNNNEDGGLHFLKTGTRCKIIATFETRFNKFAIVDKSEQIVPLGDLTIK